MEAGMRKLAIVLAVSFFISAGAAVASAGDLAKNIYDAHKAGQMVKNPSLEDPQLTVEQAYEIQKKVVDLEAAEAGGVAGYKAALTNKEAQEKYGLTEPAYGVVYKNMVLAPGAELNAADFRRLFLEVEIALILKEDITTPLADEAEARSKVGAVAPAIELPDLRFTEMPKLTGADIIADNAGAAAMILGPKVELSDLRQVDLEETELYLDGREINEGKATDAMGGQFKALLWLANAVVSRGGELKAGQFVITGFTGKMLPAKPGLYKAEYDLLGEFTFSVK
jgi:2-keto-4-pentenoate hydratase